METLFELLGWLGAFGLLTAFFLNSRKILTSDSTTYQLLNLVCALMLTVNAYHIGSYPFVVINVFWAIVALLGLVKPKQ